MGNINNSKFQTRLPLFISLAIAGGIFIGATMFGAKGSVINIAKTSFKFRRILDYIDNYYVDSVNVDELEVHAIRVMLKKLDPHTIYISPEEVAAAREPLTGNFEGIGIEFDIIKDTLIVVAPISGGPSEKLGILSGDKIIKVDEEDIAGIGLTNNKVYKLLRGQKGSKVDVTILRKVNKKLLRFTITRDKIPTYSVDVSYMVDEITGYMRITRFSAKTYDEFKGALSKLKSKGLKRLIIDLRNNPGGYMEHSIKIADEFISGNKLIVYTDGKDPRYDTKYRANFTGLFETGPLIVLINEGSASASEIVAGALQDNDRALIIGRRSFGKGFVQIPFTFEDDSEIRLTISRYYTPSGRCIQKPIDDDYDFDLLNRYLHGEFYYADSIKFKDSTKFKTLKGRTVYGGGGIMPDIFVPRDTSYFSNYLSNLLNKNILTEYGLNYYDEHKQSLEKRGFDDFYTNFRITDKMLDEIVNMASKMDIPFNEEEFELSKSIIKNNLKTEIAKWVWQNEGAVPVRLEKDEIFQAALKHFKEAERISRQ
ncbi:MAG: S41 family peptidase [Cytophagales bacterium]|nr:S41 family peptidase [Cytophagales bacterium]